MTLSASIDIETLYRQSLDAVILISEAITRRQVDRALQPLETKLANELAKLFRSQAIDLLAKLGKIRTYFAESVGDDFNDIFDAATLDTSADMQALIDKAVKNALLVGGRALIRDFKASVNFSLTNKRAIAYTENYAANAITGIDNTTKDDIRRLILAGISDGASYSEIARNIKTRYTQYAAGVPQQHLRSRAELIAVTELGNAYQAGNYAAAQTLADDGLKIEKRWLTVGDDRVSDGCKTNAREGWIDLEDDHASGHNTPLRFPGCRCVEQYRRKGS